MTVQKRCAPGRLTTDRGARGQTQAAGFMSAHSIPQLRPLAQALAHLADLRDRFWQASDQAELDALAAQYRAAYRRARRFSHDASRLIDQTLEQERHGLEQARRARAIRAELEARFIPNEDTGRLAQLEHDLIIDRAERSDLRGRLEALALASIGGEGKEAIG